MSSLDFSSPLPSSLTPSLARRMTPAFSSTSASMAALASSLPAAIACSMRHRFTSAKSLRLRELKPRLGMRMCSGIWPPSKPWTDTPERAFWPFTPRPAVLPLPEPPPRPTRMRFLVEPSLGASSLSLVISASPWRSVAGAEAPTRLCEERSVEGLALHDLHEMVDLGDHPAHRGGVQHRAHRAAGDHAGAGRRRADHDLARAPAAVAVVVQGAAFAQRHADHRLLGFFGRLADGFRHFARLAVTEAHAALLVAHHHQGGEREPAAALNGGRDAVDVDQLLDEFVVTILVVVAVATVAALFVSASHVRSLEVQAGFARGVGQGLHPAVVQVAASVEDDFLHALLDGALGHEGADLGGGVLVRA